MSEISTSNDGKWDGRERRRSYPGYTQPRAKMHETVRQTRDTLTSESGYSKEFDREILTVHARNFMSAVLPLIFLTLFMGIFSLNWLSYFPTLIWVVVNLCTQLVVIFNCKRFLKQKNHTHESIAKSYSNFISCSLLSGIVWSTFMLIPITTPSLSQPVFTFTTLLLVVAIYCFVSAPLFLGMLCSIIPPAMLLTMQFGFSGYTSQIMMAALFIGAQFLFVFMAQQIKNNLMQMFSMRAEKDNLIVDLEEATINSNESRRRAEEANLAKSRFLATMSHELRTPLNAIIGFSEIMKEELLGPLENDSYRDYVTDIHSSGDHLLNLINEILDLSRIEAGRYELHEEAVRVLEVVEDCVSLIQIRANSKDIAIDVIGEPNMHRMWADQRAIRQVVLNLLSNAVKFTPQGGQIQVNVGWTTGGGQYVSIKDNGPGIPEEEIPVVLSQFGQGSNAIKSAEQGTGLGLPICQALLNMHGGTFSLKSKLRAGTIVTASLPRTRVMEALPPTPKSALPSQDAEDGKAKKKEMRRIA